MIKLVNQLRDYFDPPQRGAVEYEYYIRTGQCNQCGQCCSGIYLIHEQEVIESVAQFNQLKERHEDYQHFIPLEETDTGVRFKCRHLQPDNSCGIYEDRPRFCKKYPSEDTLLMGGSLAPGCGFTFKAKYAFTEVLHKTADQKNLRPGKLLNDPLPASMEDKHRSAG